MSLRPAAYRAGSRGAFAGGAAAPEGRRVAAPGGQGVRGKLPITSMAIRAIPIRIIAVQSPGWRSRSVALIQGRPRPADRLLAVDDGRVVDVSATNRPTREPATSVEGVKNA